MRWPFGLLLIPIGLLPGRALGADECVSCHTDPARLHALVQAPPEIVQEEGEG